MPQTGTYASPVWVKIDDDATVEATQGSGQYFAGHIRVLVKDGAGHEVMTIYIDRGVAYDLAADLEYLSTTFSLVEATDPVEPVQLTE